MNSSQTEKSSSTNFNSSEALCDLSAIDLINPNENIELTCGMLFTCGKIKVDGSAFKVSTNNIYVAPGSSIGKAISE